MLFGTMALVVGDEVALIRTAGDTLGALGNVLFGRVTDVASDTEVLWENGELTQGIPGSVLDKIVAETDAEAKVAAFSDLSPAYQAVVVRKYTRQTNGSGTITSYTLLRAIQTEQLYEALSTTVNYLNGL